jgi:peptidoglycan/xylan/chitin deacetylase (PgdA/CDA1 family)
MSILSTAKSRAKALVLENRGFGLVPLVARSGWRSQRLLILCYHGIAIGEEHSSDPPMFLPAATFERRLATLKSFGANVLDLGEAVRRLGRGQLPPRSVSITFDDGWFDFYVNAYPVLRKFGFPATVYLTTYYCLYNRPIYLFALRHMMWKQRDRVIEGHGIAFLPKVLDLRTEEGRESVMIHIRHHFRSQDFSGKQRDEFAAQFAAAIGFDYAEITRGRLFHLMNPDEVAKVASGGIDVQLHTHRHRTPVDREDFVQEIEENRRYIHELTGKNHIQHFCYPSGAVQPVFLRWLKEAGVESATTCNHGYAAQSDEPLLLPRLLDQYLLSDSEFEAWLTGFMAFMPKRKMEHLEVAPE